MGKNKKSRASVKYTVELTAEQVYAIRSAIEVYCDRDDSFNAPLREIADSAFEKLPDPGFTWKDFQPED